MDELQNICIKLFVYYISNLYDMNIYYFNIKLKLV